MLGYAQIGTQQMTEVTRNVQSFQTRNQLPITDNVTANFIIKLDQAIAAYELRIRPVIQQFPIDESYHPEPANPNVIVTYVPHHDHEPSKNHVRYFITTLLYQLPMPQTHLTLANMDHFFRYQGHEMKYLEDNQWKFTYIPSALPRNQSNKGIYKATRNMRFDVRGIHTFYHEYAHHMDGDIAGWINTQTFYPLVFNMNDCSVNSVGWKTCARKPNFHFLSGYSDGWENTQHPGHFSIHESFAEAVSMYITAGHTFRAILPLHSDYAQLYTWLKTNMFNNREYCTGTSNNVSAGGEWDYRQFLPPSNVSDLLDRILDTTPDLPPLNIADFARPCS